MSYRYLEDVAIADLAFEARGATLADAFASAVEATLGVMIEDPQSVGRELRREFSVQDDSADLLLFQLLQEVVYCKDAEQVLFHCPMPRVDREGSMWYLSAELVGERMDPVRHTLLLDVKAVTLHMLSVQPVGEEWVARVVLDV